MHMGTLSIMLVVFTYIIGIYESQYNDYLAFLHISNYATKRQKDMRKEEWHASKIQKCRQMQLCAILLPLKAVNLSP